MNYRYKLSLGEIVFIFSGIFLGALLLSIANNNIFAFLGVVIFLIIGLVINVVVNGCGFERRAYLLSYAMCISVAGLSQLYSLEYFNFPISTLDSLKFYHLIFNEKYTTIDELSQVVNAPLAVIVWKFIYQIFAIFGVDGGAWLAVEFNSLIVAITSLLVVKCAKIIYPSQRFAWKLVGTLSAFCGLNLLFGAVLLRDCFALFFNILIFYSILNIYNKSSINNIVGGVVIVGLCSVAMLYIRESSAVLIGFIISLAVTVWVITSRFSFAKIAFLFITPIIVLVYYRYLVTGIDFAFTAHSDGSEQYTRGAQYAARQSSLGVELILNQPFIIKVFLAPVYLYLFPIPAWGFFRLELTPYYIIRGFQAFFAIAVLPYLVVSVLEIIKRCMRKLKDLNIELFLLLYFFAMLFSVATTTMESRHFGQFIFSLILLVGFANQSQVHFQYKLKLYRVVCYSGVMLLHVAWAILRYL